MSRWEGEGVGKFIQDNGQDCSRMLEGSRGFIEGESREGGLKMRSGKIRRFIGLFSIGVLLVSGAHLSHAKEIKFLKIIYGKAQERMGTEIRDLGWLEWNRGRVQEELGRVIQEGGPALEISQEALGRGIAASAQIDWRIKQANVRLAKAKVRTADIVAREEGILGHGAIQERLGAMILAKAQRERLVAEEARIADKFDAKERQEGFVRGIVEEARLNWAIGEMGKAVFATVQGKTSPAISDDVLRTVQSKAGFGHLDDFRLALTLLANERGSSFTGLMPPEVTPLPSRAISYTEAGWGGFAEYGFISLAAFVYVMWMFSGVMTDLEHHVEEKVEETYEYKKAA
ncbi:MAG: hypothetical protein ACE5J1_00850 [Nitrospiria bacterium]